ncbi:Nucleotidyl transferase AbiEii toxin, Type IV TA system [Candidatus Burarchaeum australiense]|nr:Nucleotidyl transferase AbiEii toxin, Type IV TA system [Candidatus Burarchaeum australiense]
MVEVNLEVCRVLAAQHGLPLDFVAKELYVFDVLGQIAMLTAPSKKLVFKGGTALNKVYLEKLQRFSEDLDFDFDSESITETRSYCERLAKGLTGYKLRDLRKVRDTIQFECEYDKPLGGKDHVRVDVAAKKIISEKPVVIKPAVSTYTQRFVTGFYVYSLEDLVARKLHALRTRAEGKDFYDVHNALPLCGRMTTAINKMLLSEKMKETAAEFIQNTIAVVKQADYRKLKKQTNQFIPMASRPKDWLELKNDLVLKLERLQ